VNESTKAVANATEEIAKTTGKAIDATREAGGFLAAFIKEPLQELAGIWTDNLRHRRWENALDLQQRAWAKLEASGENLTLRRIPMSVGVPLIEAATLVESTDMRELWANLIANFSNQSSRVAINKSFVSVLQDLSPLDVLILEKIYTTPEVDKHCVLTERLPEFAEFELPQQAGETRLERGMPTADVELAIANLFRLQCLQTAKIMGGPDVFSTVYTTTFGRALFEACTLKSTDV
jgi:hypothetical protein